MHLFSFIFPLILFAALNITVVGQSQQVKRLQVEKYSSDKDSTAWEFMDVKAKNKTTYRLINHPKQKVIKAKSDNAAGGLIYKTSIDPKEYPIIKWRWKVDSILNDGDLRTKKGDDYAARIYITFDYDKSNLSFGERIKYSFIKTFTSYPVPLRALNYIWANRAPKGTIAPNPFTDWVYMIAVQSGPKNTGQWITERHNILKDYKKAFGESPPKITGIAIMTDSDNTGGSTTAYYGDIIFEQAVANTK